MSTRPDEPEPFVPGAVVEMLADDPEEDLYRGDRGTILIRDVLGDLHVLWDKGRIEVWKVSDARAQLGVIAQP